VQVEDPKLFGATQEQISSFGQARLGYAALHCTAPSLCSLLVLQVPGQLFSQPHPPRLPIGFYSRCMAWNERLGLHAAAGKNMSNYYLAPVPAVQGRKAVALRVFVKGVIDGAGGGTAEEKRGLTGIKVEVGGAIEKMVFSVPAEASAGAGGGGGGGGGGAVGATAAEADAAQPTAADKSSQATGGGKGFSFGDLLSKAKKFSISMDSKGASLASAAPASTDIDARLPLVYEPVGGWGCWLRLGNRLACGR